MSHLIWATETRESCHSKVQGREEEGQEEEGRKEEVRISFLRQLTLAGKKLAGRTIQHTFSAAFKIISLIEEAHKHAANLLLQALCQVSQCVS